MAYDGAMTLDSRVDVTRVVDVRTLQARNLWGNGWGQDRFPSFAAYLSTIPPVPLQPPDKRFARAVLVDTMFRLTQACRVLGIAYGGDDSVFSLYPSHGPDSAVYWIWVQDGSACLGLTPYACREAYVPREQGLTAHEGVCLFAAFPKLLQHHSIDLPGTRLCSYPAYVASLMIVEGAPTLGVAEYCTSHPNRGSASRWK